MRIDPGLRAGLTFMTLHFQDDVATNLLTIDAPNPEVRHGRVQGHGHPGRPARLTRLRGRSTAPPRRPWSGARGPPSGGPRGKRAPGGPRPTRTAGRDGAAGGTHALIGAIVVHGQEEPAGLQGATSSRAATSPWLAHVEGTSRTLLPGRTVSSAPARRFSARPPPRSRARRGSRRRRGGSAIPRESSVPWTCTSSGRSPPLPSGRPSSAVLDSGDRPSRRLTRRTARRRARAPPTRGGSSSRSRRDLPIAGPAHAPAQAGWIDQPGLNHVCRRLSVPPAEAYGVAAFYALFSTRPRPASRGPRLDDIACRLAARRSSPAASA